MPGEFLAAAAAFFFARLPNPGAVVGPPSTAATNALVPALTSGRQAEDGAYAFARRKSKQRRHWMLLLRVEVLLPLR